MSRGMSIIDRFTRDRASRFIWGALTLACLVLFLVARVGQDRALTSEENAAFGRTERYAATVLPDGVAEGQRSPAADMNTRELYTFLRAEVFTDPTAARVRVYDRDGTIVYDTDLAPSALVQVDNPSVDRALTDGTYGVIVPERFTWSTIGTSGSVVSMLQVYAPLHVADQVAPDGVFEVDYLVDELRAAASGPWPAVQLVAAALLLLCLGMTVLSMRRPLPATPTPGATGKGARVVADEGGPAPRQEQPTVTPEPIVVKAEPRHVVVEEEPRPAVVTPEPAGDDARVAPVAEDPRVLELAAKVSAMEEAIARSEGSQADLETVRAREQALEQRLEELEQELHAANESRAVAAEPAPEASAPAGAPEPAPEPAATPPSNGAAEPVAGGLTEAEINDLRARLAKAAARKRGSS